MIFLLLFPTELLGLKVVEEFWVLMGKAFV